MMQFVLSLVFIALVFIEKRQSISPLLKKLHFLPIRYRIQYKVSILVFKCLNNIAPKYLSSLLNLRQPHNKESRLDNDFFLLRIPEKPLFKRTEGAFSYFGPKTWNSLPYSLRCSNNLLSFKKALKTHFFMIAFKNTEDI